MSQHDFNIANQGFPATRADINNAFQAIASNSSGPTAPSTTYANQWWYDTTNDKMYLRNAADSAWIEVAVIDQTNNEWKITSGVIQAVDGDGIVLKTDDGITRFTLDDTGNATFAEGTDIITGSAGSNNVRIGAGAGDSIASGGNNNVMVGYEAGLDTSTGTNNAFIGYRAGYENTTGGSNVAVGLQSLFQNTTGGTNVAIGQTALQANSTASSNTAIGHGAMYDNTTGQFNLASGYLALENNTTGSYNVALGSVALDANSTGSNNTAVGYQAGYTSSSKSNNTFVGYQAGLSNNQSDNSGFGVGALYSNTTGRYNTAIGQLSCYGNTTGSQNTAVGYNALTDNTTSGSNTAVGYNAGQNCTGDANVFVGQASGDQCTSGTGNTFIGREAGYYNTTGGGNVIIGVSTATSGYAPVYDPTTTNHRIGIGSTSITHAYVRVAWTVTSDARDKTNVEAVPHGLDFVKQLNPVKFEYKLSRDEDASDGNKRYGFLAQEVLALEGDDNVIIDNEDPDHLRYQGEALVPVLVKAVQELSAKNDALEARITALEAN